MLKYLSVFMIAYLNKCDKKEFLKKTGKESDNDTCGYFDRKWATLLPGLVETTTFGTLCIIF